MHTILRKISVLVLAALCLASPRLLFAQAPDGNPETPREGSFRLITLEAAMEDWYYLIGNTKVFVTFSASAKSEHYPLPKDGVLYFYREIPDATGKHSRSERMGVLSVHAQWKYPLVLVAADPEQKGKYVFTPYNEDPATFPAGSIRLINHTKERIQVKLSDQTATVEPQQVQTLSLKSSELQVVDVELSVNRDGKPRPIYQRGWELESSMRITVFIVKGSDGYIHVCRLRENETTFLPHRSGTRVVGSR